MTRSFRCVATAVAVMAGGVAHAATITLPVGGGAVFNGANGTVAATSGSASLSFSADLMGALDTGKVSVAPYGAALPIVGKDLEGYYTNVSVSAPISALTLDAATGNVVGVNTIGGLTLTAPALKSVSSGGSLTVTDLAADLNTKTIYATVIGGNGLGTITNLALWNYATLTGDTDISAPGIHSNTISGLSVTSAGYNAFVQSLGLLSLGRSALMGVTDFGTIQSTIVNGVLTPTPLPGTPGVPEPSTCVLMGLGLVGLARVRARRQR